MKLDQTLVKTFQFRHVKFTAIWCNTPSYHLVSLRRFNVEWLFSFSPYITVISNFACSCIEMSRLLLVIRRQCDSVLLWMPQFFSVDFLHAAVLPFLINSLPFEFHLRQTSSFPASVDAEPACATPCYCSGSHMTGSGADGVYCSVTGFL